MESNNERLRASISKQLPTATELAVIAATLARGGAEIEPEPLAATALSIWSACQRAIADCVQANVDRIENPEPASPKDSRPKFPLSLDAFLRLTVKGKNKDERYPPFRRFLAENIHVGRAMKRRLKEGITDEEALKLEPEVTSVEAGECIAKYKQAGISEQQYDRLIELFPRWLDDQKRIKGKEKGRNNANKRWKPE